MPRDIAFNSDTETTYNVRGDITNARDLDFVQQTVVVGIQETVNLSPPPLQDVEIEEQRGNIETAVRRNPFTDDPIRVTVENVDYKNETIQYRISTKQLDQFISTT